MIPIMGETPKNIEMTLEAIGDVSYMNCPSLWVPWHIYSAHISLSTKMVQTHIGDLSTRRKYQRWWSRENRYILPACPSRQFKNNSPNLILEWQSQHKGSEMGCELSTLYTCDSVFIAHHIYIMRSGQAQRKTVTLSYYFSFCVHSDSFAWRIWRGLWYPRPRKLFGVSWMMASKMIWQR